MIIATKNPYREATSVKFKKAWRMQPPNTRLSVTPSKYFKKGLVFSVLTIE